MVLEVVEGRPAELMAPLHPGGEGQQLGAERAVDGHEPPGRDPDHHHPGPQGVGQPLLGRAPPRRRACAVGDRPVDGRGAGRVHHRPHLLAGRAGAASPAAGHRGVGEGGHQHRAEGVGQAPAGGDASRRPGLDVDLDRGRRAHHRAAGEAFGVEEGLHGGVAGLVEDPPRRPEGVEPAGHRFEARPPQGGRDGGEVGGGGGEGVGQALQRRRADLDLAARFEGDAAAGRKAGPLGDRPQGAGRGPPARHGGRVRQEFDLDAHQPPVGGGQRPLSDVAAEVVEREVAP